VTTALDNLAVFENEDVVCILDRRESVCNRKCRPVGGKRIERALDQHLCLRIDITRRLIQDENL
jgi:hypothetical protein